MKRTYADSFHINPILLLGVVASLTGAMTFAQSNQPTETKPPTETQASEQAVEKIGANLGASIDDPVELGDATGSVSEEDTAAREQLSPDPAERTLSESPVDTPINPVRAGDVESSTPLEGVNDDVDADSSDATSTEEESKSRPLPLPSKGSRFATGVKDGANAHGEGTGDIADESIPLLGSGSKDWILKTLGAIGVVLGIFLMIRPVLMRMNGTYAKSRAPSGVIESLARYPFGKGQSLVLLKIDSRVILVSQTTTGTTLVTDFREPEEVASLLRKVSDSDGESFNRKLESLLRGDEEQADTFAMQDSAGSSPSDVVDLTQKKRASFGFGARLAATRNGASSVNPTTHASNGVRP